MRIGTVLTFIFLGLQFPGLQAAQAQRQWVSTVEFEKELVYYRPRIALAGNGDYAVAWEALRKLAQDEEWQIGLSRFSADGERIDSALYLTRADVCAKTDAPHRTPSFRGIENGLRNARMAYSVGSALILTAEQYEIYRSPDTQVPLQASLNRVSMLGPGGREVVHSAEGGCIWHIEDPIADEKEVPSVDPLDDDLFQWLNVDRFESTGADDYDPAVAVNASGQRVAVWVDFEDGEEGRIFGRRFDSAGRPAGDSFPVSQGAGIIDVGEGSRPEVAMLNDGRMLVVWTASDEGGLRAWGRYFESDGRPASEPFQLDTASSSDSRFPDVTSNGERFAYTWLADQEGVSSIYANIPGITKKEEQPFQMNNSALSLKGYPNPFTSETTLEYSLQESGHVTLAIFDLLGREIKKLIDQQQGPGSYRVHLMADELATGYYVTRLQQGNRRQSQLLFHTE